MMVIVISVRAHQVIKQHSRCREINVAAIIGNAEGLLVVLHVQPHRFVELDLCTRGRWGLGIAQVVITHRSAAAATSPITAVIGIGYRARFYHRRAAPR